MKTPREIAEMVNHGNDADDFQRYIEYCELAAASAQDECRVEIERLRAALSEIADYYDDEAGPWMRNKARQALELQTNK